MLDIKFIRDNLAAVKVGAQNKRLSVDLDRLLKLYEEMSPIRTRVENAQARRNQLSKEIGKASKAEQETLKGEVKNLKVEIEEGEKLLETLGADFNSLMLLVPQPARADVPIGKDDKENVEVKRWGEPVKFSFEPKDHVELGKLHDLIDIPRGVKIAGSRSYFLKGYGAMLEQAVLAHTMHQLIGKGYIPVSVPVLVTEKAMVGTGYFPTGRDQAYAVEKDELVLVGTGEVSLTSFYQDEILAADQLPVRFVTQSSCFRREAGTYGKDTKGLYRVHQFQKIEQVIIGPADPAASEAFHAELLENAEQVLRDLGLAYRVVYVCTGDLGQGQIRKHDIETWMPSRKAYSETHSCSTFHEFQARRLKMRYRGSDQEIHYCHTLNNTAIASPRILIPLLETYQSADGSIAIPECLQPYMAGLKKIG